VWKKERLLHLPATVSSHRTQEDCEHVFQTMNQHQLMQGSSPVACWKYPFSLTNDEQKRIREMSKEQM
jgi:hypothetical protein